MTNIKIYDDRFNGNEITIIVSLCMGILLLYILPRRFPRKISILFFMCGVTFGFFFDHVLSVLPVSFYDVNDQSKLELFDFISYWVYGPLSYLFYYLYDRLKKKEKLTTVYILIWALMSISMEWGSVKVGIFHYQHGYTIGISFIIYLIVFSIWVRFYSVMKRMVVAG